MQVFLHLENKFKVGYFEGKKGFSDIPIKNSKSRKKNPNLPHT